VRYSWLDLVMWVAAIVLLIPLAIRCAEIVAEAVTNVMCGM